MFKQFWENKKHVIQTVGILTGVGALFLTITPPENNTAKTALLNIQLLWLLVITISVSILAFNFFILTATVEKEIKNKYTLDLDYSFSVAVIFATLWFLFNMWRYIIVLYKSSFESFF